MSELVRLGSESTCPNGATGFEALSLSRLKLHACLYVYIESDGTLSVFIVLVAGHCQEPDLTN